MLVVNTQGRHADFALASVPFDRVQMEAQPSYDLAGMRLQLKEYLPAEGVLSHLVRGCGV
jgi:hypothetical protein